ncbi:hypothetical protein [Sorangium sp. So ce131]|uniref:hypothetical protein n=1 Tax=Sorangium sp. So ce131 TaxID=3133282 RepID=UPI003F62226F
MGNTNAQVSLKAEEAPADTVLAGGEGALLVQGRQQGLGESNDDSVEEMLAGARADCGQKRP